jgi:hypothetical protein
LLTAQRRKRRNHWQTDPRLLSEKLKLACREI